MTTLPLALALRCMLASACLAPTLALALNEELADPALVPPIVNTSPLPDYGYDRLDYGMNIGIERTPGGRLWACWVGGGDNEKAFFVAASSDDDGATWSPPLLVIDPHDTETSPARRTLVGNLWTDPRGRLWLFFDQSVQTFDGRSGVWYSLCDNPDADAPEWTRPERIWHGSTLNKPTVLSDGSWLLPISLWPGSFRSRPFKQAFSDLDDLRMANVFASRDEGETWSRLGGVRFSPPRFDEHMIIERRDGSLWMTARTRNGTMESVSTDGGRSWGEPRRTTFEAGDARHFIRRLRSGNILLVKNGSRADSCPGRMEVSAFVSTDDGLTWSAGLVLDERRSLTYPDGFEAPDGLICISYDRQRNHVGEILMARFTEADVLAGRFADKRSAAKIVISRPSPERVAARLERERAKAEREKNPASSAGAGFHELLDAQRHGKSE